jgi:hypothetical protein
MVHGDDLDRFGIRFKGYSPYGICFAFGSFATTYEFGAGTAASPAMAMQWIGVGFCASALFGLIAWHVWRWPPWFELSKSKEPKPKKPKPPKTKATQSQ